MRHCRIAVIFCCALFPAFHAGLAWQQQAPQGATEPAVQGQGQANAVPSQIQTPPPAASSKRIDLDVVTEDKSGNPVPGLTQNDFTILDNKAPRSITSFQGLRASAAADSQTHVILLLDGVNSDYTDIAYERAQLAKLFTQARFAHPISIAILTDSGVQLSREASQDGKALTATLAGMQDTLRIINRAQGFYGEADRIQLSLNTLGQIVQFESKQPGRKMLIWIGYGWPIFSGPDVQLTAAQQRQILDMAIRLSTAMRQAKVVIYNAWPLNMQRPLSDSFYYQQFLKPLTKWSDAQTGNLSVSVLAVQSGGKVVNTGSDLDRQVQECMRDADAIYSMGFDAEPGEKPNEFHRVQVKTDKPGIVTRTRNGYYAIPESRAPGEP